MSEQIFISYRRDGGDVTAKLICEALKNRGYTVFYDYDSLQGGYFDERIYKAIEECNDFVLVLPPNSLDRCVNDDDWVRLEIKHALDCKKNIIPVMLPGFSFPPKLPDDIACVARINAMPFVMAYFDRAVIPAIIDRLSISQGCPDESQTDKVVQPSSPIAPAPEPITATAEAPEETASKPSAKKSIAKGSEGLEFSLSADGGYSVKQWICTDTEICIPRTYNGSPITSIAYKAFEGCSHITSITLPDSVTKIGNNAFAGCSSLKSITIPNSVIEIGREAFARCSSLTSITIPDSVTKIGDSMFHSCSSLTSVILPKRVKDIDSDSLFYGCSFLTSVAIPDGTKNIGDSMFRGCSSLSSISIPDSVKNIAKDAFSCCKSLTAVTLPDSLMSIGDNAFQSCSSLKAITIPNRVTCIKSNAFSGCTALASITLPDSIKSIESTAFWGCNSLTSIVLPKKVTCIRTRTFSWCSSLATITLHDRIASIEKEAFDNCQSLNDIYFKGNVEQWKQIQLDKKWFPCKKAVIHCSNGSIKL